MFEFGDSSSFVQIDEMMKSTDSRNPGIGMGRSKIMNSRLVIQLGFILARVLIYVSNVTSAEGKEANGWLEQCGMNDIIYPIRFAFESHTFSTRSHTHYCY